MYCIEVVYHLRIGNKKPSGLISLFYHLLHIKIIKINMLASLKTNVNSNIRRELFLIPYFNKITSYIILQKSCN